MESPACQIIYVKRSFGPGRSVCSPGDVKKVQGPIPDEVKPLLETFDDGLFSPSISKGAA